MPFYLAQVAQLHPLPGIRHEQFEADDDSQARRIALAFGGVGSHLLSIARVLETDIGKPGNYTAQMIKSYEGAYGDLLYAPTHECPHGIGGNCECKLPRYRGLFSFRRLSHIGPKIVSVVAYARQVHDGGMVEFFDPDTHKSVGCCGINKLQECAEPLTEYVARHGEREDESESGAA